MWFSLVDAPPEILLVLASPGEDRDVIFSQGGGNLILGRVDVAGRPTNLKNKIEVFDIRFIFGIRPDNKIFWGSTKLEYLCKTIVQFREHLVYQLSE